MITPVTLLGKDGKDLHYHTTSDFWGCECDTYGIHSRLEKSCPRCGDSEVGAPNAIVEEIMENLNM